MRVGEGCTCMPEFKQRFCQAHIDVSFRGGKPVDIKEAAAPGQQPSRIMWLQATQLTCMRLGSV